MLHYGVIDQKGVFYDNFTCSFGIVTVDCYSGFIYHIIDDGNRVRNTNNGSNLGSKSLLQINL